MSVEKTWIKLYRTLVAKLKFSYWRIFYDRETLEISADPPKIIGIAKLYCGALVISPAITRFFNNVLSCRKTIKKSIYNADNS